MSSALGGVMDKLLGDLNTIRFDDISPNILTIIQKNDFLSHFGYQRVTDINQTINRIYDYGYRCWLQKSGK